MTFNAWLRGQRKRQDRVGDLARDVRRDPSWPEKARLLAAYERYLERRNACEGALRALEAAWWEFTGHQWGLEPMASTAMDEGFSGFAVHPRAREADRA